MVYSVYFAFSKFDKIAKCEMHAWHYSIVETIARNDVILVVALTYVVGFESKA